jgi:two-component system, sensor histidine kinase and response regulator
VPPYLHGLNVLLVDDNETCRMVMRNMVESFGFQVELASSGEEALTKIKDHYNEGKFFGMVLLDWKIPDMDGITIAKKINQDPHYTGVPIIMITAFGREEEMNQAEQAGIADFLVKPVKQSMLFDTIMSVLSDKTFQTSGIFSSRQNIARELPLIEPLGPFHVLLVEDIYVNQLVVKEMLRPSGVNLEMANNGKEALHILENASFDLVLMDIQMPEMDGIEATRRIRKDNRLKEIPIIAMTAHAMKSDRDICLQAGMDDYITKPVDKHQLYTILKKWLPDKLRGTQTLISIQPVIEKPEEFCFPERLVGIEVGKALQRLMGNQNLFVEVLQSFNQNFASAISEIRDAWAHEDFKQMQYLVHTLKGTAGNIAANDLQAAALNLERAVKDVDRNAMGNHLTELESSLSEVLKSIQKFLTDMTRTSGLKTGGDQEAEIYFDESLKIKLLPLFNKLAGFIKERDPVGSQDVVNLLIEQLDGKRLPRQFEKIITQIDSFQFEAALSSLAIFLGNLMVS